MAELTVDETESKKTPASNGAGELDIDALVADADTRIESDAKAYGQELEAALSGVEDATTAERIVAVVVRVVEGKLGDRKRARRIIEDVIGRFADASALYSTLADITLAAGDVTSALDALAKFAEKQSSNESKAETWERMGDIAHEAKRPQDAVMHYQAAFRAHRQRVTAVRKAARIYLDDGREELAKQLLDLESEVSEKAGQTIAADLADVYLEVAEGLVVRPGAHATAQKAVEAALRISANHPGATKTKVTLDEFPQKWKEHVRRLRDAALDARDKRDAARKYLSIAQIYREYAPDDAAQMQQNADKCLLLAPGFRPALKFLEDVYRSGGRLGEFVGYLKKQAGAIRTVDVAVEIWLYIAVLMAEQGATVEELAEAYEKVRAIDPRNASAISALTELHLENGRFEEAAKVMEDFVAETSDAAAKRSTLRTLARIYEVELNALQKSADTLEALRALGGAPETLVALADLYGRLQDEVRLAATLELIVKSPSLTRSDAMSPAALLERLWALYEGPLAQPEKAFTAGTKLYALTPRDALERELVRLADALARAPELAEMYLEAAKRTDDARAAHDLRIRGARAFVAGGDARRGRAVLDGILAKDAKDKDALDLLDRILEREAEPEELVEVLEGRLQAEDDPRARVRLLLSLADAYDRLRRAPEAISRLQMVVEIEPGNDDALEKLDAFLKAEERWSDLASVVERRLRSAVLKENATLSTQLRRRLARLFDERLDRGADAAATYLELYDAGADDSDVVRALERLLDRGVNVVLIAGALQPYYARVDAWRRHVEMIQIRRNAEEDPVRRAMLSQAMAEILEEKLRSPKEAFEAWSQYLLDEPSDADGLKTIERLANIAGVEARFADVLLQVAERLPEGPAKNAMLARRATLLQGVLGDEGAAIVAHIGVLEKSPAHIPSLDALANLYEAKGAWSELAEMLTRRLALANGGEAAKIASRLGAVLVEHLNDLERAESPLRLSTLSEHALSGTERTAGLRLLASVYRARGADGSAHLAEVLPALADGLAGDERARVRVELGDLRRERLSAPPGALDAYEAALANDKQSAGALAGLRTLVDDDAIETSVRRDAGRILATRYAADNNLAGRVHLLGALLSFESEVGTRRRLVAERVGLLVDDVEAPEDAFEMLIAHIRRDPVDDAAHERLDALSISLDRPREPIVLYGELAKSDDRAIARVSGERMVALCQRLGDLDAAVDALRGLIQLEPNRTDYWERLRALYDRKGNALGVAECLQRLADLTDGAARVARLQVLADFAFEVLEDAERGLDALRDCRKLTGDDDGVLAKLHARLREFERFEELIEVTGARAEQATQQSTAAALLLEQGMVLNQHLARPKDAVRVLTHALEVERDGNSTGRVTDLLQTIARRDDDAGIVALDAIVSHHRTQKAWQPLVESLEIAATKRAVGAERARIFDEVSDLQENAMRVPQLAFRAACLALRDEPTDERVHRASVLADATASFSELATVLEDVAGATATTDAPRAIRLLRTVIDLAARRLDDKDAQVRAAEAILTLDRTDAESLALLESIHRTSADEDQLIEVLRRRAESSENPAERRVALIEMGQLLMARQEELQAERCFRRVLHEAPADDDALTFLDELYTNTGNSAAHIEILERRIQSTTGEARADLWCRLALLKLTRRGDPAGATDAFTAAVVDAAASPPVRHGLEALVSHARTHGVPSIGVAAELLERAVRAQGDWSSVPAVMELRLQGEPSRAGRALLLVEIAQIQETKLDVALMAFKTACRALHEVPEDASIRDEVERLAVLTESEETLALVYDDLLEQVNDPALRVTLNRRMAEIAERVGGDVGEARERLQAAVQAGDTDLGTLKNLVRLTRDANDAHEHADALARLAHAATEQANVDVAKEAYFELCDVAENRGDIDFAIRAAKELLSVDGSDSTARVLLERLLSIAGRWADLEAHLARFLDEEMGIEQRADVLARAIYVRLERTMNFEGAVTAIEDLHATLPASEAVVTLGARALEVLRQEKRDQAPMWRARIAVLLEPRYEAQASWPLLVDVLRLRLEVTRDASARKQILKGIIELCEKRLDQPEQAFFAASRALQEDPADKLMRDWAERISIRIGDMETLVGLYEDIVEAMSDDDPLRVNYATRCGELYEGGVGDPVQAARFYEKAVDFLADDARDEREDLLDRLENLYRRMSDAANLARTLRRRAENKDPKTEADVARQMLYEAATIQMHGLQDWGGAIESLRKLLVVAPHDLAALKSLSDACERQGRYSELAEALERELVAIGNRDPARAVDARFRLAVVLDSKLDSPADADAHFAAILQSNPDHVQARAYLEARLGRDDGARGDGAKFLEESYEATGDFAKAVDVLQQRLVDVERRGDKKEARDICVRIADLQEQKLAQPDLAFMALGRAFKNDPADVTLRGRLLGLAKLNELIEELCDIYEDEAVASDGAGRGALAAELREHAASIQATELGDLARAISSYEEILEKHPGRLAPLEGLTGLYLKSARYEDHEKILRRRLMFLDDAEDRVPLLMSLAETVADHLDRPQDAIPLVQEVRTLRPDHQGARRLLIALVDGEGDTVVLRTLLEEEVQNCREIEDNDGLDRFRRRLAILLSETLKDTVAAIPLWEEIHGIDPGDRAAFLALERLYPDAERYGDLKTLFEGARGRERDPNRISELEQKLGKVLAEHLGGVDEAIERHLKVLEFDPRNQKSLDALRGLYKTAGRYEELVALVRKMMRFTGEPKVLKALRFELAEVVGEKLEKRAEAVETGRRILDIEPHAAEELDRLTRIFRLNEAFEEVADCLERQAALLDGQPKVERLLELARVHEDRLRRPENAAPAYKGVLDVDPGNELAYEKLSVLLVSMTEWQQLVGLKEDRLATISNPERRRELLIEIGKTQEEQLGQKELAFLTACRAFREDFNDDDIATWLDRLAVETDTVSELLEVYDDALGHISEDDRIISTHLRMAELAWKHVADIPLAELHFTRVLEYDAKNHRALDGIVTMFVQESRVADAVSYLERKVDVVPDNIDKIEILRRIAAMLDADASDVDGAVAAQKRILELDGTDRVALRALGEIYERTERWQALISTLEREESVVPSVDEKMALRYRAAGIWEQELGNADQAVATYRSILDDVPAHTLALKALERLFTSLERSSDLIAVFETMVLHADDEPARIKLLGKIASTWEESFEDLNQSVSAFDRVLAIDAKNVQAVRAKERLLRQLSSWDRLVETLRTHVTLSSDPEEIVRLYIEIGDVYYRELGNSAKAEEFYAAALDHDPDSRDALNALGQLYERSGNWFNALEKLTAEAQIAGTTPAAVDLYYRIGKINEDMLLDVDSAQGAFERALELDTTHLPSIQALKEIAKRQGRLGDYLKWLRAEAQHTDDDWGKTELHTTAGVFLQDEMSDLEGAEQEFEKALAVTFDHLAAAQPLSEISFRNEKWDRAESLYDIIVERMDPAESTQELCRTFYRLGYVCEKLAKEPKALRSYQRAYELDATYLPVLEGLGAALNRADRWEDASKIYHAILIHHRDGLTDAEVVDYYQQLATLNHKLKQDDRARKNLEKALELDSTHAGSLRLLAEIQIGERRYEDAYETLMQLAPVQGSHDRVETLIEIGRLSKGELKDAYRAIDAYEDANRQRPGDKSILASMLDLYRETRQGARAVEILEELVRIEPDETARVRLNVALGDVYRDEIKNESRALQYFNAALDLDPTFIRAFEAVETMLSASANWKSLEENYIGMLRRIPDDRGGIKLVLWRNLGDLYRFKLKSAEGAAQAFTVLHRADEENVEYLEILADLVSRIPGRVDDAITYYEKLFPLAGDRQKAILHALVRLYLSKKQVDRVYVITTVLKALRDLQPDEEKIWAHYSRQATARAKRQIGEKQLAQMLIHPYATGPLKDLSAALWRGVGTLFTPSMKDAGLDKKRSFTQLDLDAPVPHFVVTQIKYARDVLGVGAFDLFVKRGAADPLAPEALQRPTLVVGEGNEVFREMPQRQLWFVLGRQVGYLFPPFIFARLIGAAKFQALVDAAIRLVDPRYPAQGDARDVAEAEKLLQRAGPNLLAAIRGPVNEILKTKKPAPVAMFLEGVEHTAIRSAHLLGGDLEVAAAVLRQPDVGLFPLAYNVRMKELVNFTVSSAHFSLREYLGVAIPPS